MVPNKKHKFVITVPLGVSILAHVILISGLIYTALNEKRLLAEPEGKKILNVMMVNTAAFADNSATMDPPMMSVPDVESYVEPEKKVEPEIQPEPIIEEKKPEPIKKEPVPIKKDPPKIIQKEKPKRQPPKKLVKKPNITKEPVTPLINQTEKIDSKSPISDQRSMAQNNKAGAVKKEASKIGNAGTGNPNPLSRREPAYPMRALSLRIKGEVKVKFDVNAMGQVINITVISAKPKNTFEREVLNAMKRWRYESKEAKNLVVTIIFDLDNKPRIK